MIYSLPQMYLLQPHVHIGTNTMCIVINYNAFHDSNIALIVVRILNIEHTLFS